MNTRKGRFRVDQADLDVECVIDDTVELPVHPGQGLMRLARRGQRVLNCEPFGARIETLNRLEGGSDGQRWQLGAADSSLKAFAISNSGTALVCRFRTTHLSGQFDPEYQKTFRNSSTYQFYVAFSLITWKFC